MISSDSAAKETSQGPSTLWMPCKSTAFRLIPSTTLSSSSVAWPVALFEKANLFTTTSSQKVGLDSDVFVRSALIDVYAKWGELKNALCVFNEMVTEDLVVSNSIIGGFAENEMVTGSGHANECFEGMY
ncbi:hypothetical protein Pint_33788 [Pistacia integerrima]|uniref:Uncharacterized protein n=1 Tax=Pistacia integerrima TaxID=434235 RepID=A0ACC0X502_9ROSI|nr:hypothetical protein Pint_33788 [Pistacia integerrima]